MEDSLKFENVARGLGFATVAKSGNEVLSCLIVID